MIFLEILALASAILSTVLSALNGFALARMVARTGKGSVSAWPFIVCALSWAVYAACP